LAAHPVGAGPADWKSGRPRTRRGAPPHDPTPPSPGGDRFGRRRPRHRRRDVLAHAGESNVDTFRFGASNSGAASGAGGCSGKATIRTLVLGKPYDSASPLLLKRVATGQHIPSVTLTQQNAAGVFQTIKLEDVTVVDVEQTSRQRNNAEKVCLKFGFKATVEYRPTLADGTLGAPVSAVLP
jgi:type VI protein secretion system component Hcp